MFETREQFLTEAAALLLDDKIMPAVTAAGYDYARPNFRISVGFPPRNRGGKVIAVCFIKEASTDGVNEIFINPTIDDPIMVLDSVAHELIHAVDNCASGHRNFFARIARAIGLDGPFTATYAGPALRAALESYVMLLGEFPHKKMDVNLARPKQGTRQLKIECSDCGFTARASAKWVFQMPPNAGCPICDAPALNPCS